MKSAAALVAIVVWANTVPPVAPTDAEPTSADIEVLRLATRECHLHEGALSFVHRTVPVEPVIRMTRAYGDTQEQLDCALKYFPADFNARFGVEFEVDAPR
jgi:hypothetical protein